MSTVSAEFVIDFKPMGATDSFIDPNLIFLLDPTPRIVEIDGNGTVQSGWTVSGRHIFYYTGDMEPGQIAYVQIEKPRASDGGGECGPGLYDDEGNGYELKVIYNELRVFKVTAGARVGPIGTQVNMDYPAGAIFRFTVSPSGVFYADCNGTLIAFEDAVDTTYDPYTLKAGAFSDRESSGASGIWSFGVNNIAGGAGYLPWEPETPIRVGGTGYEGTCSDSMNPGYVSNGTITYASSMDDLCTVVFDMQNWVDGQPYIHIGNVNGIFSIYSVDETVVIPTELDIQLLPPVGFSTVDIVSPNTTEYSVGVNPAIENGTQVSWPTVAGTINADGTLTDFVFGTYACWLRDSSGIMRAFNLIVNEAGQVIVDGLKFFQPLISKTIKVQSLKITPLKIF